MKNIFLTLALTILSTTVFSQIKIRPGVRGGANFSKITNTNFESKKDFYIGVFANIEFASFYALQPELNYSRQGGEARFGNDLELQYLGVSVANKFYPFKAMDLHFIIGPTINIKTGDNMNGNFDESIEGFDLLVFGGLGYDFPSGFTLEARYNIGLVDIFGSNVNNNDTIGFDELFLNKFFQIGAAYKFDF